MDDPHTPPAAPPPPRPGGGPFRWISVYTRGMIFNQRLRRLTMFYVVIAAMLMFFAGDWVVPDWRGHLLQFALYWLACGWLTILAALLAVYDLLLIRVQHRLLRRELRARILGQDPDPGDPEK